MHEIPIPWKGSLRHAHSVATPELGKLGDVWPAARGAPPLARGGSPWKPLETFRSDRSGSARRWKPRCGLGIGPLKALEGAIGGAPLGGPPICLLRPLQDASKAPGKAPLQRGLERAVWASLEAPGKSWSWSALGTHLEALWTVFDGEASVSTMFWHRRL